MTNPIPTLAGALALLALPAFALPAFAQEIVPGHPAPMPPEAVASFIDANGMTLGEVRLTQTTEGVHIRGDLARFQAGEHGFHIHENGVCDPATGFESAGGHYNPDGNPHGHLSEGGPHAGDMPNLMAGEDGAMRIDVVNPMVTLGAGDADLLKPGGTALILHEAADDYASQPGGEAGGRIACAVIAAAPTTAAQ